MHARPPLRARALAGEAAKKRVHRRDAGVGDPARRGDHRSVPRLRLAAGGLGWRYPPGGAGTVWYRRVDDPVRCTAPWEEELTLDGPALPLRSNSAPCKAAP